ncbi:hypothetical protein NPIL_535001 [Nephila pilipes]|uniref:Uncharacterized protein n=1 Tax=Nephila pilipes TaxID=299642 RepID=A0A8X6R5E5_NEPPI|nr:hypothetical protein NPIL_535001 [Nephila pilipes]
MLSALQQRIRSELWLLFGLKSIKWVCRFPEAPLLRWLNISEALILDSGWLVDLERQRRTLEWCGWQGTKFFLLYGGEFQSYFFLCGEEIHFVVYLVFSSFEIDERDCCDVFGYSCIRFEALDCSADGLDDGNDIWD